MNIESTNVNLKKENPTTKTVSTNNDMSANFADELKAVEENKEIVDKNSVENTEIDSNVENEVSQKNEFEKSEIDINTQKNILVKNKLVGKQENNLEEKPLIKNPVNNMGKNLETVTVKKDMQKEKQEFSQNIIKNNHSEALQDVQPKKNNPFVENNIKDSEKEIQIGKAIEGLNSIVNEFNQSEDKNSLQLKKDDSFVDKNIMINNDFNIQENKDILPQMSPNMNFSGDGQPFSSFMNNEAEQKNKSKNILPSSAKDLAEEEAILSTMAENIAIANRNQVEKSTKVVTDNEGVKRVDVKTGIKVENIVKFDSVVMNQADVEVFANLVEKGEVNLNNLAPQAAEKTVAVSKTLADLLAKSMEKNQPVRIDFDNNISVIIKVSRDGKITADFLPSSQVAEAYLKENLPLLRQRFDDNNIDYESLNQRERREQNKENSRKKGRNNE